MTMVVGLSCEVGVQGLGVGPKEAISFPKRRDRPKKFDGGPCVSGLVVDTGEGAVRDRSS